MHAPEFADCRFTLSRSNIRDRVPVGYNAIGGASEIITREA